MLNILLRKMYAKMYFCIKCIFAQLNIFLWKMYALQKCIFASNAFVTFCVTKCTHQMHFGIKCTFASNAFVTFCFAEHFPLENVQRTFYEVKCSASHFPKENVQQTKMLESGQHKKHQTLHFCRHEFYFF